MLTDFYKGKKILVTGGSGSIGQKIVAELLKYDVDVVNCAREYKKCYNSIQYA